MKKILAIIFLITIPLTALYAQRDEEGYRFMKRIRGLQIPDSKVQEVKIDEATENLVISYRAKRVLYIAIYKLYSWDKVKEFRLDAGVELYNSFFAENGAVFYANTDLYKQEYVKITIKNGNLDTLQCAETPKGCAQVESRVYDARLTTADKKWLLLRDDDHDNDVLVYFDQLQFNQIKKELEEALQKDLYIREVKESIEQEARDNQKTGKSPVTSKTVESKTKSGNVELSVKDVMTLIETGNVTLAGTRVQLSQDAQQLLKNPTIKAVLNGDTPPQNIKSNQTSKGGRTFKVGEVVSLNNILFAQGKSEIQQKSYPELDKLVSLLNSKPTMKIEVHGHTNNVGTMNQEISEDRAKAVVDYLVSKGIRASRLSYKGFGDTKPIASNDTEEGRAKNRRVEFVIVAQ